MQEVLDTVEGFKQMLSFTFLELTFCIALQPERCCMVFIPRLVGCKILKPIEQSQWSNCAT